MDCYFKWIRCGDVFCNYTYKNQKVFPIYVQLTPVNHEMDPFIRTVSGQRLSKHVLAAMVTHATGESECRLRSPRRGIMKRRELGQPVS
jgi:hypothetical protein